MPKLMRFTIVASALALGLGRSAVANGPQPISPPPQGTPSQWPVNRYGAVEEPRTLPTVYQAPSGQPPAVSTPAPLHPGRQTAAQQPIPLPPQDQPPTSPLGGKDLQPLVTGATSLGIVLGLFLLVVWTVRRGSPRGAGLLPPEAVEVLGRVPLAGRQQAHLVRCGNKIVLVSVTAGGVEPLTEITDPLEVDRLESICRQGGTMTSPLKQFLGRFGSQSRTVAFNDRSESMDFRHLEASNHA